jgi:hypothetical protein
VAKSTPESTNRIESILAVMIVTVIGASLLAFVALLIGTATGAGNDDGFSEGLWPTVILMPLVGLPIGFVLVLALLIINMVRRSRGAKRG